MKTIHAIEKKGKVLWLTTDHETFSVEPDIMIKYHLKPGLTLDEKTYDLMIHDNQYLQCLKLAYTKLKKMLTIQEMQTILASTPYGKGIQKQVVHMLIEKKYLDDYAYAKMYLELKKYKEGPEMMLYHLKEKGISQDILEQTMMHYRESEMIKTIIEKKLSMPSKKPKRALIQQIKNQLLVKGFHREVIESILLASDELVDNQDEALIHRYGTKLFHAYQDKYSGHQLRQKVKEKLYQKGFAYEDIKHYLETIDLQSW